MILINITKHLDTAEGPLEAVFALSINDGEFLTLFGASGAGKTTLLRVLARALKMAEEGL